MIEAASAGTPNSFFMRRMRSRCVRVGGVGQPDSRLIDDLRVVILGPTAARTVAAFSVAVVGAQAPSKVSACLSLEWLRCQRAVERKASEAGKNHGNAEHCDAEVAFHRGIAKGVGDWMRTAGDSA
jgi:hypothetical protein